MGKRSHGGDFLARGVETCVYTPPVQCAGPAQGFLDGRLRYVSRVVRGNLEKNIQKEIKEVAKRVNNRQPELHFPEMLSLYDQSCTPLFRPEDIRTRGCGDIHRELESVGEKPGFVNLVTPFAAETLMKTKPERSPEVRVLSFAALMQTALVLNYNGIVHGDAHFQNIMWMDQPRNADNSPNPHLVFADWGRTTTYDIFFGRKPSSHPLIVTFDMYRAGGMYQRRYIQYKYPERMCAAVAARKPAMSEIVKQKLFTSLDLLSLMGSAEVHLVQTANILIPQHADQLYNLILQNIVDDTVSTEAFAERIRDSIKVHVRGGLQGRYDKNWRYLILAIGSEPAAAPPPPVKAPEDFRQYGFAGPQPQANFLKGVFGGRKNSAYKTMKNPFANVLTSVKKTARKVLGLKKRKGGKKTAKAHRRR